MDEPLQVGDLVVDAQTYSLVQVCMICGATTEWVIALVSFGIVVPEGDQPALWRFSEREVHRAKKALRLHRDLGLDHQGLAMSLELLDEIDRLRVLVAKLRAGSDS